MTDRQTDRQTDDTVMPIVDHTSCSKISSNMSADFNDQSHF